MTTFLTLAGIGGIALFLATGGLIADHILPRIPAIERFLDSFEQ